MKKYIAPELQVVKLEMVDSILTNSYIDVGGSGDHFDSSKRQESSIWGEENRSSVFEVPTWE